MYTDKDTNKAAGNTIENLHLGQKQATGGRAVPGVIALAQRHAKATVLAAESSIIQGLNLRWLSIKCLGSAGRRKNPDDTSGDIDIAISRSALGKTRDEALDTLEKFANQSNFKYQRMNGIAIVSIAFPISGLAGSFVQVDLMVVEDLNWVKWAMYSPDYRVEESRYKGGHRNWLIAAICNDIKTNTELLEDKQIGWDAMVFVWHDCAKWIRKTLIGERGNQLMHPKKLSEEVYTRNPDVFVNLLFGDKYTPKDLLTYEDVRAALEDEQFKESKQRILNNFVKFVKKADLPVPEDAN